MFQKILIATSIFTMSGLTCASENGLQPYGLSFSVSVGLTSDYRFRGQT